MSNDTCGKPLICINCKNEFEANYFESQLEDIIDFCHIEGLKEKLDFLLRTEKMHNDYPDSKEKMIPKWELGDVTPPTEEEIKMWTNGDSSLAEYLLTSSFDVVARKKYIQRTLESREKVNPVECPICKNGIICFKKGRLNDFLPRLSR